MHHGGVGLSTHVLSIRAAGECVVGAEDWAGTENTLLIKSFFAPLVHNILFRFKRPKRAIRSLYFLSSSERIARVATCIEPYFPLQMHAKPELAHRLQTSTMHRNSTSLKTCQYDVNIVTICVATRCCIASLTPSLANFSVPSVALTRLRVNYFFFYITRSKLEFELHSGVFGYAESESVVKIEKFKMALSIWRTKI